MVATTVGGVSSVSQCEGHGSSAPGRAMIDICGECLSIPTEMLPGHEEH